MQNDDLISVGEPIKGVLKKKVNPFVIWVIHSGFYFSTIPY